MPYLDRCAVRVPIARLRSGKVCDAEAVVVVHFPVDGACAMSACASHITEAVQKVLIRTDVPPGVPAMIIPVGSLRDQVEATRAELVKLGAAFDWWFHRS